MDLLKNEVIKELKYPYQKNLIDWDLFKSFIQQELRLVHNWGTGYIDYILIDNLNNEIKFTKMSVNNKSYLSDIEFINQKGLTNPYNGYANPFFIFHLINENGKKFFCDYYKQSLADKVNLAKEQIESAEKHLTNMKFEFSEKQKLMNEVFSLVS